MEWWDGILDAGGLWKWIQEKIYFWFANSDNYIMK
jgi:hypothetical protein